MAWIDPPKNKEAGGVISHTAHGDDTQVFDGNEVYNVGFECERQWFFPFLSHHYEAWEYQSFVKFKVPTLVSGALDNAQLHLMVSNSSIVEVSEAATVDMLVYYKTSTPTFEFPWVVLSEDDYDAVGWTLNSYALEDFDSIHTNRVAIGPYWVGPVDVTEAVQDAIGNSREWIAFKFVPNEAYPVGWDYDERVASSDQRCWLSFWGALNAPFGNSPSGFPDAQTNANPWLEIVYSGGDTQYIPGEDVTAAGQGHEVTSLAVDYKTQAALAGTISGGLWFVWSGGGVWEKIYEIDEEITAVWMDIVKNLQDYPEDEVSYFGTVNGNLYRSVYTLGGYYQIASFVSPIVDIMSSNTDSNKVVVGTEAGVWVSRDGGTTWLEVLEAPE